jgi:hypothetical protein
MFLLTSSSPRGLHADPVACRLLIFLNNSPEDLTYCTFKNCYGLPRQDPDAPAYNFRDRTGTLGSVRSESRLMSRASGGQAGTDSPAIPVNA